MYFQSNMYRKLISSLAQGANINNIKNDHIDNLLVNVADATKQQYVVSTLGAVNTVIQKRKAELQKLDELVKARFVEMFGDETQFDKWKCGTVGDVADVCVGVVIKPTQYYTHRGVPAFRSLNIGELRVKDADWVYFTEEGHKRNQKSVIRENDVLVVRSGAPGTACVATAKYAGYNAVDIIIAHPDNTKINSVFLAAFTNMPHGMIQIKGKTGGAAQQHFNVGGYKSLRLILPPMELQNKFADFVAQVDKSKVIVEKSTQ
jgi:type I restriction enzyme S subunit